MAERKLGQQDFLRLFGELDQYLKDTNPDGGQIKTVACGGAAIAMMDKNRQTVDVDIISDRMPQELREAIRIVGQRHGLNDDWMNDGAKIWGFKKNVYMEPVFTGRRLRIYIPDVESLLILKLEANRENDSEDIKFLLQRSYVSTADKLLEIAEDIIPKHRLTPQLNFRIVSCFQQ